MSTSPPSLPTDLSSEAKEAFEKSSDFANYFCTYGYLYHQKQMLTDTLRMQCYRDAIKGNPAAFKDKVVLDVGTGSGILAIWAAQAGARKVYAVEATSMAVQARKVVAGNHLSDIVTVIQGKMEEVKLPEKVDIIISEWMGYFLLRESMLDSVLYARDTYLVEGGSLFPSHCTMYLAASRTDESTMQRMQECDNGMVRKCKEPKENARNRKNVGGMFLASQERSFGFQKILGTTI